MARRKPTPKEEEAKLLASILRAKWHEEAARANRNRPAAIRKKNGEKSAHTKRLKSQKVSLAPIGGHK